MSNRFYTNCPIQPGFMVLRGSEAHHLAVVCRVRPNESICLFNGDGREYPAAVREVGKKQVTVEVLSVQSADRELPFRLELAAPLPKGDRAQFLVEKLTELGTTAYVLLRTERSIIDPGSYRLEKLERYVIEASKQTGRNVLMRVEGPVEWETYCRRSNLPAVRILANPGDRGNLPPPGEDVVVAVGPEGGFTAKEVDLGRQHGWLRVSLGARVLRTETAALVMAAWGAGITGSRT
jgi:16S rRNA (uracil1498-N3)-methyltransferase